MPMRLGITTEVYSSPEDQRWLGSAHGVNTGDSITLDGDAFLGTWASGVVPSGVVLAKRTSDGLYIPYVGTAEKQSIAVDGTGGTFTLALEGQATGALAFNISAADLQTALEGLPNVDVGDVVVTGGPGDSGGTTPYFVEFVAGDYAEGNVPAITATDSLTGGAGTVTITTPVAAPTSGAEKARGHLLTTVQLGPKGVDAPTAGMVGETPAALYWHGEVIVAKLPANSGWDSRVITDLPQIRYET